MIENEMWKQNFDERLNGIEDVGTGTKVTEETSMSVKQRSEMIQHYR